ncbi:MAG TPA: ABC transporter ATP-binding protein [Chryseosolibacter sp.]|nr:ABC transporter ATP-binding protein [Chryseosolibacter sp.]
MKPILEVQHLSKKFMIRHETETYLTLRERLVNTFRRSANSMEEFWALDDVSFQVSQGESIGIIGRNGAGKSTLLKVLSRITVPTKGRIVKRGSIASLLEVGTGFHPELTGRENVYLNGSLLGMKRAQIRAVFDEIVDFSGVEKFLDTPLKHFSTGMQLRLAFAVAAFLDPEILVIDEVLAVGDAEFQKKCLRKMEDVNNSGRTILFVSHDLDAVERLCKSAMILAKGRLVTCGPSSKVISDYLSENEDVSFKPVNLSSNSVLEVLSFKNTAVVSGASLEFTLRIRSREPKRLDLTDLAFLFYNYKRQRVGIFDLRPFFQSFQTSGDFVEYTGVINRFNVIEGNYYVGLFYGINGRHGDLYDLTRIQVKGDTNMTIKPYHPQYRGFVELN